MASEAYHLGCRWRAREVRLESEVMEPRLVLFDVDGTLVDTAGAGRRAIERAFETVHGVDLRQR